MESISPISKNSTTANLSQPTASLGIQNISDNYDTFLNLLTAQLRNQDPLDPMDPTQFVAQLAQFSQLEQSVAQTTALENLVSLGQANEMRAAIDFLGRSVDAVSDNIKLENGAAMFSYEVNNPGEKMEVRIFDSNDNLLAKLDAENTAGRHMMAWDGKLDKGGDAAPGVYHAELVAVKEDEAVSGGSIIISDKVRELRYTQAGATLYLDSGVSIYPGDILSVQSL